MRFGVEKDGQTVAAHGIEIHQVEIDGDAWSEQNRKKEFPCDSGHEHQGKEEKHKQKSRSEVVPDENCGHNESAADSAEHEDGPEGSLRPAMLSRKPEERFFFKHPCALREDFCKEESHDDFCVFGRLDISDSRDFDPSVCSVDCGKTEVGDKQQQQDSAHEPGAPVGNFFESEEEDSESACGSGSGPHELFNEESGSGGPVGSGVEHGESEHEQHHGDAAEKDCCRQNIARTFAGGDRTVFYFRKNGFHLFRTLL